MASLDEWFTTVLDAMVMPRAEWQAETQPIFGSEPAPSWYSERHPYEDVVLDDRNPLPIISTIG